MIIDDDSVYRRLNNSSSLRRDLLNTAIESIKLLQDYERIKGIKKEKHQLLDYSKEKILELNKRIEALKQKIPKAKIEKEKTFTSKIKVEEVKEHKFKIERPKIDSLSLELESIKNKLQGLNIS